jgi:hypothetical protein
MRNARVPQDIHHQILGTVDVPGGAFRRLKLGTYAEGHEPPVLIGFDPDRGADFGIHAARLEMPGNRFELVYQFQNFGSGPCRVVVRAALPISFAVDPAAQ